MTQETQQESPAGPRIYLAIDNCFASKRWTHPAEWTEVIADLGVSFIEASADNECDPLYAHGAYLRDWLAQVRKACRSAGVRVANLYSGHGTYTTLGLSHTDPRNRRRMLEDWLKVMVRNASRLGAGLGFYCHAFCDAVLQDRQAYEKAERELYDNLAELAAHARRCGLRTLGVESMYAPHQIPWTICGAKRLMKEVLARAGHPFYITLDTGHQTGQRNFIQPGWPQLKRALARFRAAGRMDGLWLGTAAAYGHFRRAAKAPPRQAAGHLRRVEADMAANRHLFAMPRDADPYLWLEQLACYAPIIHLQQTDGTASDHLPFTRACNRKGTIRPRQVLDAIATSYARPAEPFLPPRVRDIYMTLEIFSGTSDTPMQILERLADSVAYWRKYIPADGLELDALPGVKGYLKSRNPEI